jgi:hypothetical protein
MEVLMNEQQSGKSETTTPNAKPSSTDMDCKTMSAIGTNLAIVKKGIVDKFCYKGMCAAIDAVRKLKNRNDANARSPFESECLEVAIEMLEQDMLRYGYSLFDGHPKCWFKDWDKDWDREKWYDDYDEEAEERAARNPRPDFWDKVSHED